MGLVWGIFEGYRKILPYIALKQVVWGVFLVKFPFLMRLIML